MRYSDPAKALEFVDMTAKEFSNTLLDFVVLAEGDISKIIRKTVIDIFGKIVERSPVDTGLYKSSHGLSVEEPNLDSLRKVAQKVKLTPEEIQMMNAEQIAAFDWTIDDDAIYFYNPVEYAKFLENGSSGRAPSGVYAISLTEFDYHLKKELAGKYNYLDYEGEDIWSYEWGEE